MKENYQIILNKTIDEIQKNNTVPSLLLHSCCAPCSSYVLEYLSEYFDITIFYYNPNISPEEEFYKRVSEQKRLINEMPLNRKVKFIEGMTVKNFIRLQKGLKISKKVASVALNVTDFVLKKQQKPPKRTVLITSLPRFR